MKIAVDVQALQSQYSKYRGIGRYTNALFGQLLAMSSSDEYIFYGNAHLPFIENISHFTATTYLKFPATSAINQSINQAFLTHWAILQDIELIIVCSPLAESFNVVIPDMQSFPTKVVTFLYDLIPYIFSDQYLVDPYFNALYTERLHNVCAADLILTISEASRKDAINLLEIPEYKIVNISSGISSDFRPLDPPEISAWNEYIRQKLQIRDRFVLYAGGDDWRKNLPSLIQAFAQLPTALQATHKLVIAGELKPENHAFYCQLAQDCGVRSQLNLVGYVSDELLRALYSLCAVFVFPSLYEGFGLPVIEAMACGAPVIAGQHSSLIEAGGNAALLLNPITPENLARAIGSLLQNPHLAAQHAHLGLYHAAQFTWQKTVQRMASQLVKLR